MRLISFVACTSTEFLSGSSGFFSSPNFPSNFPKNSSCTWNITVPIGYTIKVSFLNFTLERCYLWPTTSKAHVLITNVASAPLRLQSLQLCGPSLPPPVYSLGNSIQVIFTSFTNQLSGFNASYTAITQETGTTVSLWLISLS